MAGATMAKKKKGGRPKKPPGSESYKLEFVVTEPGFMDRLNRQCSRRGLSRSAYMRQAVMQMLERDEQQEREILGGTGE